MLKEPSENPWRTKSKTIIYENPWIRLEEDEAINPSGETCQYGVIRFQNIAVGILPITQNLEVYLVGQHRYPFGKYSWELPEGGSPYDEPPLEGAKRELKEETGLIAKTYTPLLNMHLSNSVTDEKAIVYLAQDLSRGQSNPEPSENITVKKIKFEEAVAMVMNGTIKDAITIAAILKLQVMMQEQKWQ